MNIKYSIIIPCYKQSTALLKCLAALSHQTYDGNYEIIVVYHDEELKQTLISQLDHIKWVLNEEPPNPYHSRNIGTREASGVYYCFLDAKCIPRQEWLFELDQYIQKHPNQKVLAGHIHVIPASAKHRDSVHGLMYLNNKKNIERSYGVPAGHLVIHETIFGEYGGFYTQSRSGNDIMYTKNLRDTGLPIHYVHGAIVDYEGLKYAELKSKMRKYAGGVVNHHNTSLKQILFGLFPMRLQLFRDSLRYRNMGTLRLDKKWRLWMLVWRLKFHFAMNLMQVQLRRYFGASRGKG